MIILTTLLILGLFAAVGLADTVDVSVGLDKTDQTALAGQLLAIFKGIGALIGVVAVGALIYNGFRLATAANEQVRAEVKNNIMWTMGAVALVALALMIVGWVVGLVTTPP